MGNVLTFNDLPDVPSSGNFTAYQGFHFEANNIPGVSDESQSIAYSNGSGYVGWDSLMNPISADEVAQVSFFASDTLTITRVDGSDFSFLGGDFAQMNQISVLPQLNDIDYTFTGYNNGLKVGDSIVKTIGMAEHVDVNMVGVDEVKVTWVAGSYHNLCFDDLLMS